MPRINPQKGARLFIPAILIIFGATLFGVYTVFYKDTQLIANSDQEDPPLPSPVGQHRPAFILPDMNGTPRNINEWDNKVLVVNFWATWCKPCRREIPLFTQLQTTKGPSGLQFIGVAIDEKSAVNDFIAELGTPMNYPTLIGEDDAITIAKQYGNEFGILPYTVIIDRNGQITYIQYGEFTRSEVEQEINTLL